MAVKDIFHRINKTVGEIKEKIESTTNNVTERVNEVKGKVKERIENHSAKAGLITEKIMDASDTATVTVSHITTVPGSLKEMTFKQDITTDITEMMNGDYGVKAAGPANLVTPQDVIAVLGTQIYSFKELLPQVQFMAKAEFGASGLSLDVTRDVSGDHISIPGVDDTTFIKMTALASGSGEIFIPSITAGSPITTDPVINITSSRGVANLPNLGDFMFSAFNSQGMPRASSSEITQNPGSTLASIGGGSATYQMTGIRSESLIFLSFKNSSPFVSTGHVGWWLGNIFPPASPNNDDRGSFTVWFGSQGSSNAPDFDVLVVNDETQKLKKSQQLQQTITPVGGIYPATTFNIASKGLKADSNLSITLSAMPQDPTMTGNVGYNIISRASGSFQIKFSSPLSGAPGLDILATNQ